MSSKIEISGVGKVFPGKKVPVEALNNINLEVRENEFVSLVGASGCGKSTLLRIIGGLESASTGQVTLDSVEVKGPGKERAMVFQDYALYPWLTVLENIRCCRKFSANTLGDSIEDVASALDRSIALMQLMDLDKVSHSYPNQLSGGMRQRVAIARSLLSRPQVLLMDEPFGALDAQTREVMHDLLLHLFRVEKTTIIFVTHDVEEAIYLSDRVVVLSPNPGRVDSIYDVPLPETSERNQDHKLSSEFLALKKQLLTRIRQTSNVYTDFAKLEAISNTL